ncbi:hypothetical protein NO1_1860 [Candidatus Termititenax aidoneus]|uniref:Uncharacterized protein n=1 Tax=Termititenax aidoneus TaxID=2218524 RepID=A0A388TE23_TERA1|nr:hypothetical protein NO1_1860 [Candidatus Termititenax aidoneus]
MLKKILVFIFFLTLAVCGGEYKLDLSTPDAAVKSYYVSKIMWQSTQLWPHKAGYIERYDLRPKQEITSADINVYQKGIPTAKVFYDIYNQDTEKPVILAGDVSIVVEECYYNRSSYDLRVFILRKDGKDWKITNAFLLPKID